MKRINMTLSLMLAISLLFGLLPITAQAGYGVVHAAGLSETAGGNGHGGGFGGMDSGAPPENTEIEEEEVPLLEFVSYAEELNKLGLFQGYGVDRNGTRIYALENPLTRIQALILTIRLLGREDEALVFRGGNPFTDVSGWQAPYVAFALAYGLASGVTADRFAPHRQVTVQEFTTFMLRALGYSEAAGDFRFANALSFAVRAELLTYPLITEFDHDIFLRGEAVIVMLFALQTRMKGRNYSLIDTLVTDGVFSRIRADEFLAAIAIAKR